MLTSEVPTSASYPDSGDKKKNVSLLPTADMEASDSSCGNEDFLLPLSAGRHADRQAANAPVPVSVLDVAAYILSKTGEISAIKLEKLVYYCQAWSLVWDEQPLFPEPIEAWRYGPVIPALYRYHRGQYLIRRIGVGLPSKLSTAQRETIDAVLDYYGTMSAQALVNLSHSEKPWQNARIGVSPDENGGREISLASMAEYYASLTADNDKE